MSKASLYLNRPGISRYIPEQFRIPASEFTSNIHQNVFLKYMDLPNLSLYFLVQFSLKKAYKCLKKIYRQNPVEALTYNTIMILFR